MVQTGTAPVPLDRLAERAAQAAADGSPRLRKGTHVRSWSMGMSEDEPPVTVPEERIVRWWRLVDDGHVISDHTYPPSWSDAPPQSPPPNDPTRLRAYLTEAQYTDIPLTTPQLLDAVRELLDHWTLGARESATLARLLAGTEGLRPVGRVTDRLGRHGQAYVCDGPGARRMLIMDPVTGAVLGLETTFTTAEAEYGVKQGDVMSYSAWLR